jgi:hypothetical protein
MIGPSAAFLAALVAWVSSVSGLPVPPTPRVVVDMMWPYGANVGGYEILGEVHLRPGWDQNNIENQAELAHELVHVAQNAAHIFYHCDAERERLAYAVQAVYLAKFNVDFWKEHPPRWLANLEECR